MAARWEPLATPGFGALSGSFDLTLERQPDPRAHDSGARARDRPARTPAITSVKISARRHLPHARRLYNVDTVWLMLHRWISVGALLATAMIAIFAVGCGENKPKEKPAEIELKVKRFIGGLEFGKSTKVSGRLMRAGTPLTGEHVRLEADEFPFGDYESGEVATTDVAGKFRFRVKPEANTRYRVVAEDLPETTSSDRLVPVIGRFKTHFKKVGGGHMRLTIFVRHSPRISLDGFPAYQYVRDHVPAGRRAKIPFVKTTKFRKRKAGLSATTWVFRPPGSQGAFRSRSCVPFSTARGMGRPTTSNGKPPDCTEDFHRPFVIVK